MSLEIFFIHIDSQGFKGCIPKSQWNSIWFQQSVENRKHIFQCSSLSYLMADFKSLSQLMSLKRFSLWGSSLCVEILFSFGFHPSPSVLIPSLTRLSLFPFWALPFSRSLDSLPLCSSPFFKEHLWRIYCVYFSVKSLRYSKVHTIKALS